MIVMGVDFSEGAAGAVALARDLSRQQGTTLHFVHVESGAEDDEVSAARRRSWLRSQSITAKQVEVRTGVPWVELVRAAEEERATFVVVGTHGETGFQPLRLGTTATHVALRSTTPVILVPPHRTGVGKGSLKGEMMKKAKRFLILGVLALATLSTAACGKKPAPVAPAPAVDDSADRARREAEERARREAEEKARSDAAARAAAEAAQRETARIRSVLETTVFFDYDDSTLRTDARALLDAKVQVLRTQTAIRLKVVGHADERGSTEYNLALGMRRAQSVREYMAGFGIAADRLEIQSMGEERPLEAGHDDASWSRNRRAESTILTGLRAGS